MKKLIPVILFTMILAACGGDAGNKQLELEKLLKQQADLNTKIRTLREEIQKSDGDDKAVKLVVAENIKPALFSHYIEIQARVDGDQSVMLSPRSAGTVTSIPVKEGDKVTKGQTLASLDDNLVKQSLAEVETQYNFANNIYEKQKNLWDQKIGSEVQYLTAKNNKESLEKRLAAVREQLDMTRIESPINGTVDNINLKIGQSVMPGMPAISVVNLSKLKVKGEVGESYAGKINKGDNVILEFPDLGKEVNAKVGYAARVINSLNRTFNVEVPLEAGTGNYSPNMVVVMKIMDYRNENAMVLPVDLLQRSAEGNFLMVAVDKGGKLIAERRVVNTGLVYNGNAEIISGLSNEDRVITVGYRDLNDGQEVRTR